MNAFQKLPLLLYFSFNWGTDAILAMCDVSKYPVVVTGSNRGFGREIALQAAREGYPVIGLARKSANFESMSEELGKYPGSAMIECDLESPDSMGRATLGILARTRHIGALIHSAERIGPIQPLSRFTAASFKECLDVNLVAVDYITRRLLPILGDHRALETPVAGGSEGQSVLPSKLLSRVCVITSDAAHNPVANWSGYCVAKAGLLMWARCAAVDLAKNGISVIAVQPGLVDCATQISDSYMGPDGSIDLGEKRGFTLENKICPSEVALKILPLLLKHPASFSGGEYAADSEDIHSLLKTCVDATMPLLL